MIASSVALLAAACASTAPSSQLVSARDAYVDLKRSNATEYAPDEVLTAKQALDRAEAAHDEDPGSTWERHYAYLATRQAQLAKARSDIKHAKLREQQADADYTETESRMRMRAEESLQETRRLLTETQRALGEVQQQLDAEGSENQALMQKKQELEQRKQQLESSLAATGTALQQERQARREAEQRAKDALASLNELAKVKEEARETVITLSGQVLFTTGKSKLLPVAKARLQKVADALKEQGKQATFMVEGHTDSRGSEAMNEKLSQARADSVRDFLLSQGLSADRLKAVGQGESQPIAQNDTPEGRANNRRVEIHVQR